MTATDISRYGRVERTSSGVTIRFERQLEYPIERVWQALTESSQVSQWLAGMDGEVAPGATLHMRFGPEDIEVDWRVVRAEPPRLLEIADAGLAGEPSTIRWELEPAGPGCRLRFTHEITGEADGFGTCTGWHIHLDLLESLLRGEPVTYKVGHDDALEAEYRARA